MPTIFLLAHHMKRNPKKFSVYRGESHAPPPRQCPNSKRGQHPTFPFSRVTDSLEKRTQCEVLLCYSKKLFFGQMRECESHINNALLSSVPIWNYSYDLPVSSTVRQLNCARGKTKPRSRVYFRLEKLEWLYYCQ
jgi:hypothetical protein